VIGHLEGEHRTGRNYLAHSAGDAINAVLAAVGYNFRLLLNWLALMCAFIAAALSSTTRPTSQPHIARSAILRTTRAQDEN
jgi:IS5 family transposase